MSPRMILTAIFSVLALVALGCAPANAPYGDSLRQAIEAQKLNPGPASLDPVTGLDGAAAKAAMDKYRNAGAEEDGGAQVIKSQMQPK
ncbi:MAG: hypothetical protein SVS15_04060 [Thermodesulfobacteriota bacterium]|nr:hypothetical protein [Thermodesulfobacteriota bacterium]